MPVVYQAESLAMGWCLDCHRGIEENPERHLVPQDKVTQLEWAQQHFQDVTRSDRETAMEWVDERNLVAPENCGACHY